MIISRFIYYIGKYADKVWQRFVASPFRCSLAGKCGKNVRIGRGSRAEGWRNIEIGDNVKLGVNTVMLTTRAKIIIRDHVIFGPGVTIVTGNHRIDYPGRYIDELTDADKLPENDQDVVLEGDNWIGANAIILKGVTIGRGSVVASGSVVTKDVEAYSIAGGVPAKEIGKRFNAAGIEKHESILAGRFK